jgi:hypothetical protein
VRLLHELAKIHATFDDANLVPRAGLVPVMALAEQAGLAALFATHVRSGGPCGVNAGLKIPDLVAGMAAGADSIDDVDLLRHGAMPGPLGGIWAPFTLGVASAVAHLGERAAVGDGEPAAAGRAGPADAADAGPGHTGLHRYRRESKTGLRGRKQGAAFEHTKMIAVVDLLTGCANARDVVTKNLVVEAFGGGLAVRAQCPYCLGAVAVQVVTRRGRQVDRIEHVGSAHSDAEFALLLASAHERLSPGQVVLDLGSCRWSRRGWATSRTGPANRSCLCSRRSRRPLDVPPPSLLAGRGDVR